MSSDTEEKVLAALATGPKTKKDLIKEIGKARRTIYTACRDLVLRGIVQTRPCLRDTRQDYFFLAERDVQT